MFNDLKELYAEWEGILPGLKAFYAANGISEADFNQKVETTKKTVEELLKDEGISEAEFNKKGLKQLINVELKKINEDIYLTYMVNITTILKEKPNHEELEAEAKELLRFRNSIIEKNVIERARELNNKCNSL